MLMGRFLLVSTALALCAVVALFALAADQYGKINSTDELASKSAVNALKSMLQKQAAMDQQEASLFAQLTHKKAAVHHAAAAKKAKHSSKAKAASKDNSSEVAKLKAELAAAEAKNKKDAKKEHTEKKAKKEKKHLTGLAKIQHDESYMTTGKDFEKLHGGKAKHFDSKIAKEAGLKDMGWMGSKSYIDTKLRALHCDPSNFMCTGTKKEKKEAFKMIEAIQNSITGDAQQVKAYAWKQEHALPPAPKM